MKAVRFRSNFLTCLLCEILSRKAPNLQCLLDTFQSECVKDRHLDKDDVLLILDDGTEVGGPSLWPEVLGRTKLVL